MAPYEGLCFRKSKIELALELGSGIPNPFQSNRLRMSCSRTLYETRHVSLLHKKHFALKVKPIKPIYVFL